MQEKLKSALAECIKNFENENAVSISSVLMQELWPQVPTGEAVWEIDAQILPL